MDLWVDDAGVRRAGEFLDVIEFEYRPLIGVNMFEGSSRVTSGGTSPAGRWSPTAGGSVGAEALSEGRTGSR